jgi:hypothetical protein
MRTVEYFSTKKRNILHLNNITTSLTHLIIGQFGLNCYLHQEIQG